MYEDIYSEVADIESLLDDDNVRQEERRRLSDKLRRLKRMLGEEVASEDDLIDKWEREIAEGRTPDLDEGVPDGE